MSKLGSFFCKDDPLCIAFSYWDVTCNSLEIFKCKVNYESGKSKSRG